VPYLIDGNNLLGSWGGPAVAGGREEALRRVAAFCRARGARAILVFDGAPFRSELGAQELGAVSLRFPAPGQDADSLIRAIVEASARPAELIVVTSDKALYSYVKTRGAPVLRAHEWNRLESRRPARVRSRAASATASEKPAREDDVEGWLRRFEAARSQPPEAPQAPAGRRQRPRTRVKKR
jgi:predicted RNA-binding protein with PIN domain